MVTIPLGIALMIVLYAHFLSPGADNVLLRHHENAKENGDDQSGMIVIAMAVIGG